MTLIEISVKFFMVIEHYLLFAVFFLGLCCYRDRCELQSL